MKVHLLIVHLDWTFVRNQAFNLNPLLTCEIIMSLCLSGSPFLLHTQLLLTPANRAFFHYALVFFRKSRMIRAMSQRTVSNAKWPAGNK